jgi:hypothetical protein
VSIPFRILYLLIAASPAIAFVDGAIVHGLVAVAISIALGAIARGVRPGEADHLAGLLRPAAAVFAIPAAWMLIQTIPVPAGLVNPIWASAASALGQSILGSIGIDRGATLVSFIRYLAVVGIGFTAVAVAIDRRRAETLLFWLNGSTGVAAALLVIRNVSDMTSLAGADDVSGWAQPLASISALGTVIASCAAIRAFERYETRRSAHDMTFGKFARGFAIALCSLAICWIALLGRPALLFAAACGAAALALIELTRRLGLGRWISAATAGVAVIVASAVAVSQTNPVGDLTLRFARGAPAAAVSVAGRILADTSWTGSGAGTFSVLAPIYRGIDEADVSGPPTTAAAISI